MRDHFVLVDSPSPDHEAGDDSAELAAFATSSIAKKPELTLPAERWHLAMGHIGQDALAQLEDKTLGCQVTGKGPLTVESKECAVRKLTRSSPGGLLSATDMAVPQSLLRPHRHGGSLQRGEVDQSLPLQQDVNELHLHPCTETSGHRNYHQFHQLDRNSALREDHVFSD